MKPYKRIIVAGGRDFIPTEDHINWITKTLQEFGAEVVVCGMAKGADMFGYKIAEEMKLVIDKYPARWEELGKMAGYIRNIEMAKNADACILFPGGKGTAHMERTAKEYGLHVVKFK